MNSNEELSAIGDRRNGPSARHGRTEKTYKHYNGVCPGLRLSDYLAYAA